MAYGLRIPGLCANRHSAIVNRKWVGCLESGVRYCEPGTRNQELTTRAGGALAGETPPARWPIDNRGAVTDD